MKLGLRLLLGFFLITGIAAFFVLRVFMAEVKPSVREVMEDMLVDTANILAELAVDDLARMPAGGTLDGSAFATRVRDYAERPIDAQIWGLSKRSLDYRVYVTDAAGRVVFDTGSPTRASSVGQDYSQWRDVALTLKGGYGARATRELHADDRSSVMYVAAPIRAQGRIIGVLTVAKPTHTVQKFIDRAEREILVKGLWLLGLSLAVGVLVTAWIVWSVRRLRHYAQQVQWGRRGPEPLVPPTLSGELGDLALAMGAMRDRLDGREHLEHTVRALTHELKSPLAAIGGAAELLQEDLPPADRRVFVGQIQEQAQRLNQLVERMLELSKLEHRQALDQRQRLDLVACLHQAQQALTAPAAQRRLAWRWITPEDQSAWLVGDAELLQLALSNVLDNAIAFAPPGGQLELGVRREGSGWALSVRDGGPGVPATALPRLGERFFSTARPLVAGQASPPRKGSGLGLAIVQQVLDLHGGHWRAELAEPGLRVTLWLPAEGA
jgi:two-component system sensor histidine kinase CreC